MAAHATPASDDHSEEESLPLHKIGDWDDAYTNGDNIPGGARWPALWAAAATPFREKLSAAGRAQLDVAYGARPRNRTDLFLPEGEAKGLVVYVHGGYWRMLDNSFGSHQAAGPLAHGYAVAMPTYTLAPEVRIAEIVGEVASAINHAAQMVPGPINLTGHSAGGHLVTRMVTTTSPLSQAVRARIRNVVSISGVHDLRPIMNTAMNRDLHIDVAEAQAESPVLLTPIDEVRLTCWVGGGERSEFIRQSALLTNIWTGLGASTDLFVEPDRHHFNVVDGLVDPDHPMVRALVA